MESNVLASTQMLNEHATRNEAEVVRLTKLPMVAKRAAKEAVAVLEYYVEKVGNVTLPQGSGQAAVALFELKKLLAIGDGNEQRSNN